VISQLKIDIPLGLAEHIQQQRRLNPRDRDGRGWQSRSYTDQPFAWFETVYRTVEAEVGAIDSWWFNVNTLGEYTNWHAHDRWRRVAVLYVSVPGGDIEFRQGEGYWTETPRTGDLLVFPGSLEHQVRPNTSKDVRISVAFNFKN
jgi:hypothetical protein